MKILILLFLLCSLLFTQAQTKTGSNDLFYSITIGAGIGRSPDFELSKIGIGGIIDFSLQKNKSLATIGYRGTGEFQFLAPSSPAVTMTSIDLLYGRWLTDKKVSVSINTGIGLVGSLRRGQLLYVEPGLFGAAHYEKLRSFTIGLPISLKTMRSISKHVAIGLESYVNINTINTFYGLNLCLTFKKYKF
ncbi:MAG: hypothetical protein ABIP30_15515 [Ferruginibacter sp.]